MLQIKLQCTCDFEITNQDKTVYICCNRSTMSTKNATDKSWRGVPLSEIYGSDSPWGAPEFPLISPSYNHAVLFHVSGSGRQRSHRAPSPQRGQDKWDKDCVRMPCSMSSLYPVEEDDGSTNLKRRWEIIESALQKSIKNSYGMTEAILTYNTKFKYIWKFPALHEFFNEYLEEDESEYFFNVTLPEIAKLALELPHLIQSPVPLLRQHKNRAVSLTQQQISCLLANAFFCTFPRRNTTKKNSEYASYPQINFNSLYESSKSVAVFEKLKCICHYFRRVCSKVPAGVLTFIRQTVEPKNCPQWSKSEKIVGGTPLHINSRGTIEDDGVGLIQIDFANKYLGGGVLNRGCVQEEIRFVICPELLVSMLFTEFLKPTEALLMIGCERFSKYTGYGHSFQWAGDYEDNTPVDSSGRRRCAVLAIDALPFSQEHHQYKPDLFTRELNKAWSGVSACTSPLDESRLLYPGVATGNWGCGAFGGTPDVKWLLQLMAFTEARRPMAYYTFGDDELLNLIFNMYNYLSQHNITVGQLYRYLLSFSKTEVSKSQLYPFIYQLHRDQEKQNEFKKVSKEQELLATVKASTSENYSPDLFSPDEEEMEKAILEEINFVDLEKGEGSLHVYVPHEKQNPSTNKQTSLLFEEMTNFDEENSKLNLNSQSPFKVKNTLKFLDADTIDSCSTSSSTGKIISAPCFDQKPDTEGEVGVSAVPTEVEKTSAKKMAKKITDYFNKKCS